MFKIETDHNNCRGRPPNRSPVRKGSLRSLIDFRSDLSAHSMAMMSGLRSSTDRISSSSIVVEHELNKIRTGWVVNYRAGPFELCPIKLTRWPGNVFTDNRQRIPIPHVRARAWVTHTCFGSSGESLNRHNHITQNAPRRQSAAKRTGKGMSKTKQQCADGNISYLFGIMIDTSKFKP